MRRAPRARARYAVALALALVGSSALVGLPVGRSSGYAVPPAAWQLVLDRELLSNLSAPSVAPGSSSAVAFTVHDPAGFFSISNASLSFQVYALNGYPGGDVGPVPVANAPVLENRSSSGLSVNVSVPDLRAGDFYRDSVTLVSSAATPTGTYAVRAALSFRANGSSYRFESRGWFNESVWASATSGPNGSATVNVSRLVDVDRIAVSGLLPETAVYVAPSDWPAIVGGLVAAGLGLLGLGAWLYFRRGSKSRSGAASPAAPGETNAPSAFGNRRSNPGDSRSN